MALPITPPPIPKWEALHPAVVHIPIGALIVAPILLVAAMLTYKWRGAFSLSFLLVLAFGAGMLILAVETGEATNDYAIFPTSGAAADAAVKLVHQHSHLAHITRTYFLVLAEVYGLIFASVAYWRERLKRPLWIGLHVLVLLAYGYGLILIANVGDLGGRMVHEMGVRAPLNQPIGP